MPADKADHKHCDTKGLASFVAALRKVREQSREREREERFGPREPNHAGPHKRTGAPSGGNRNDVNKIEEGTRERGRAERRRAS